MKKTFFLILLLSLTFSLFATIKNEDFRIQKYTAFPHPFKLAQQLQTSPYCQFENPTGIYFQKGEKAFFEVSKLNNKQLSVTIHNFDKEGGHIELPLKEGINSLIIPQTGLAYINYFSDNWENEKPIKIKIVGGKVNGYFDSQKHNNEDWQYLLKNAACNIIDIRGKYVQLAFPISKLQQFCPNKGTELINIYDHIIQIQHELMGIKTSNSIQFPNHMFGRVIWQGYMHADQIGAAFHFNTMDTLTNPDRLKNEAWGVAHEFGHVNQTRPGFKWVSTTEVTNNIFSAWTQYLFTPNNLRLEHEVCFDGIENNIGGRFNSFLNSALIANEQWLCQKGPDKLTGYENGGDHFVKLCPLWQLQLYYVATGKNTSWYKEHFYGDITSKIRKTSKKNDSNGQYQLNFMKYACDVAKEDLTDFFSAIGMLKPIDKNLDDYTRGQLTITQQDCQNLIIYAKRYPKPVSPVIYYINGNAIDAFSKQKAIIGTLGKGVSIKNNYLIVSHHVWKNIVAFECYQDKKLLRTCIVNTGDKSKATTQIFYPQNATRLEGVAWNGERTLIYGKRD